MQADVLLSDIEGRILGLGGSDAFANEDVGERGVVEGALAEGRVAGGSYFLVDAPDDGGAVDIEVVGVLDVGEDGAGGVPLLGLEEHPAINYKVVHCIAQFYCTRTDYKLIIKFRWTPQSSTQSRPTNL